MVKYSGKNRSSDKMGLKFDEHGSLEVDLVLTGMGEDPEGSPIFVQRIFHSSDEAQRWAGLNGYLTQTVTVSLVQNVQGRGASRWPLGWVGLTVAAAFIKGTNEEVKALAEKGAIKTFVRNGSVAYSQTDLYDVLQVKIEQKRKLEQAPRSRTAAKRRGR